MSHSKKISLGSRDLTVAALNFKQLDEHKDDISLLMKGFNWSSPEDRAALVRVLVVASAKGGDPITEDELAEHLDISNAHDVLLAFVNRNGFVSKEGEQGEARATPLAS
jgi:hypothetical protein